MTATSERREGSDRRRQSRGGRRPGDVSGFTPLVMVVDGESRRRDISETILAKLQFAVAPVESADKAAAVYQTLDPEVIVAGEKDARRIRELVAAGERLPIVTIGEENRVTDALVEAVRLMLHARILHT